MLLQMCAHNGHRCGVHQHYAVVGGAVPAVVLAIARLRRAAPLRHALTSVAIVGRYANPHSESWFLDASQLRLNNYAQKSKHDYNLFKKVRLKQCIFKFDRCFDSPYKLIGS
jgi:hypothetical protein